MFENITGNVREHSGECSRRSRVMLSNQRFVGMFGKILGNAIKSKIPGNVQKDSGECSERFRGNVQEDSGECFQL